MMTNDDNASTFDSPMRITITETAETQDDMVTLLRHIADQIADGFTSGYYPHWSLDNVQE